MQMIKNILALINSCVFSLFSYAADPLDARIETHNAISEQLAAYTEQELKDILAQSSDKKKGWGETCLININGTDVFVKKIPLTYLEQLPENYRSTANLFNLPLFYQYGVGSGGFGAWRELESHLITTNWVKSKECGNFPMLYHWCIMEGDITPPMTEEQRQRLEKRVTYWEGSAAVRSRLEGMHNSSACIVLFLECVPHNLHNWLPMQIKEGGVIAENAVAMVMSNLKTTTDFMKAHGFIHFDAHFHNILTDGKQLFFTDFGLSLSRTFNLSVTEIEFFDAHESYDECHTLKGVIAYLTYMRLPKSIWESKPLTSDVFKAYLRGDYTDQCTSLEPYLEEIVQKYACVTAVMVDFFDRLCTLSKLTPYPKSKLEAALAATY